MSFIHENPVLVAPRPVRIAGMIPHHTIFSRSHPVRLLSPPAERIASRSPDIDDSRPSADNSPRASPRSALPSEALEEFLSILRPSVSIFPPNSPRRRASNSIPAWNYERPTFNFKPRARIEAAPPKSEADDLDAARSNQPSRNALSPAPVAATPENDNTVDPDVFADSETASFRWFSSGVLSSPISRMHTRNPFLRHVATQSPTPVLPPSPATIPLPTPTPDELLDLH
ncbi:hypothetical protein D9756_001696 [Leucocoprinus leucothites]|uniref:Uncharacterized protein n=1 Tax=Leucocoprinus leucothites TaxID=201217 RepID=A0A8H5G599_9AGAR|nr:hypothetical protein D9756_001696 [Leucoagaricus leucothites]